MAHGQGGAEIARERRTTLTCNHEAPIVAAPVTRNVERPRADGLDMPIAFSSKDYGGDACYDLSPTLRAGNHAGSHANAGSPPGIAYMADDYKNGTFEQCDTARTLTTSAYRTRAAPIVCTGVIGALGTSSREDGTGRGQPIVAAPSYSICLGSDPINALELAQPITRRNGDPGTITTGMAVRRLTPVECERLQAFPDFYTLIPMGIVSASRAETIRVKGDPVEFIDGAWWKLSVDGPRYKALGNSMCTNNIAWIGRRIELALARQMVAAA